MDIAGEYNHIPEFWAQQHQVQPQLLQAVGAIFIKHGVHQTFGLVLLHRHEILHPGFVMVHTLTAEREDIGGMQAWKAQELYPSSFFINSHHHFVPCEFSTAKGVVPDPKFLSELQTYFTAHDLTRLLGVAHIVQTEKVWVEREFSGGGTIATEEDEEGSDGVITFWQFLDNAKGVRIKVLRKCETGPFGGHKVTEASRQHPQSVSY